MQRTLVDTSTLWDLVFYFQERHRRNRSVASSAAAALESLIVYSRPAVESSAIHNISGAANEENRFLKFYCDNSTSTAIHQFQSLLPFCETLEIPEQAEMQAYSSAITSLGDVLAEIADPDDIRAYEMYDYLPYHLGEDPTAVECWMADPSVTDLELLRTAGTGHTDVFARAAECLKSRQHPTRAAWALPLIRLFYYTCIQNTSGANFVPHATKSTIAFGREAETVTYRRLLEYCNEDHRNRYLKAATDHLGGLMLRVPIPRFADVMLQRLSTWDELTAQITVLRDDSLAASYRKSLGDLLDLVGGASMVDQRTEIESVYQDIQKQCDQWAARLRVGNDNREIRIALSLGNLAAEHGESKSVQLMLLHNLFSSTGISGMKP